MSGLMYPPSPAVSEGVTGPVVHGFLKHPAVVTKRLSELLDRRMLADYLLTGRIVATGGVVLFESGWPAVNGQPEPVAPGAEYPTATIERELSSAQTTKWASSTEITDEAIARMTIAPLNDALTVLSHQIAKTTDTVAMSIIASAVTATFDVTAAGNGGAWTSAEAIIGSVLAAKATAETADEGVAFDTVLLTPTAYARTMALLVAGGVFPREATGNPLTTGEFPQFAGLTWVASPRAGQSPLLADRTRLGALAFEDLADGYARNTSTGLETKVIRLDERDAYKIQARRVFVPLVTDPTAGLHLTSTGI